jgi:hypothetical protein
MNEVPMFKSNAQLASEELAATAQAFPVAPFVSSLAQYVRNAFQKAEQHRTENGITDRLLKSQRLRSGRYDGTTQALIIQRGGSDIFYNITDSKCAAFTAWAESVFSPSGDRPWDAQPTPIPSLDEATTQDIYAQAMQQFAGMQPDPQAVRQYVLDLYDKTLDLAFEDARKKCDRMVRLMDDQTTEGGLLDAMAEFLEDMGVYPTAIIKGPVWVRKKVLVRDPQTGAVEADYRNAPTWECVDPFRFYPGPNARSVADAYVCEIVDFDARLLSDMRGAPGWKTAAIEEALGLVTPSLTGGLPAGTSDLSLTGETEKAGYESRVISTNNGLPDATLRGIEFWGSCPGQMLQEWGMEAAKVPDANKYYEVNCVLIGNVVVRAILNPDPLDRRPYYTCSFKRNKNSIWGLQSIPEAMEDCQNAVNAAQRNMLNNAAMGCAPQVAYDLDAIPPEQVATASKIWPWKTWAFLGSKAGTVSRKPIEFFQPDMHLAELMQLSDYYKNEADDRTHIPRYVYGDGDLAGAGATSSGLSQLRSDAQRGIQKVFKNIDRMVLRPIIERLYTWNMVYQEDDSIKGDLQIVARGILALMVREQITLRRQEFLQSTANPIDMQIIGVEGRAALLREIAKGLDIPGDKVVPTEEVLQQRAQQQQMAQQQQLEAQRNQRMSEVMAQKRPQSEVAE